MDAIREKMEFEVVHVAFVFETKWCCYNSSSRDQLSTTNGDVADDISVYGQTQANSKLFLDEILLRTIISNGFCGMLCEETWNFEYAHLLVF